MKDHLTDRALKKLAKDAQEAKKPIDMMDDDVKAFGARAQSTGTVSFILYRRFPGSPSPVRRTLGYWGGPVTKDEAERREKRRQETGEGIQAGSVMSLPEARELARDWISAIKKGRDPSRMAEQEAQANIERERVRRVNTVESVLQSYFRVKGELRSIRKMEVTLRRELASWLDRSIQDISVDDIEDRINAIKPRGKSQARFVYALIKAFFSWAVKQRKYGLVASPCVQIDAFTLVGRTNKVTRVLDDAELRAYWKASEALGYPYGHFFRFVALTALRRDEAAAASWPEFGDWIELEDMGARRFIIPHERMKAKPGADHRSHLIPITEAIASLLRELPRLAGCDFLFSSGTKPISGFGRAKAKLDAIMRRDLEAQGHAFEPFTTHDVRRSARTRFSSLGIPEHIGERLLAHAVPELQGRYNLVRL